LNGAAASNGALRVRVDDINILAQHVDVQPIHRHIAAADTLTLTRSRVQADHSEFGLRTIRTTISRVSLPLAIRRSKAVGRWLNLPEV